MTESQLLPPDRGRIETEHRNPASMRMHEMDTDQLIELMVHDHSNVVAAVRSASNAIESFIDTLVPRMRRGGRLIYVGAGTSGRLGVLDASECPPTFQTDPNQVIGIIAGGESALRRSSEGKEDDWNGAADALTALKLSNVDTVLGIAAGGTTPYVLGALRLAKLAGALAGMITCAQQTLAPPDCDHLIVLNTGPEILTGSTRLKAGSATKLVLNIISTATFVQLGKVYSNLMVDLKASNDKLTDRAIRILIELCPELTREEAMALLRTADNQLKPAILAHKRGWSMEAVHHRLSAVSGSLSRALAE